MSFRIFILPAVLLLGLTCLSCHWRSTPPVLVLLPFQGLPHQLADSVYQQLRRTAGTVVLAPRRALPNAAYYPPRHRYRADSLLRYLVRQYQPDTVVIGLTQRDISTTKNDRRDWGVLGLGYQPGRAAVASSFRLRQRQLPTQFYKVVLHEIGHTQGLPHCPAPTCFMRDAEGGNPTDKETGFCSRCAKQLRQRGWALAGPAA
ncbi:zinc-dependent metalloprotease family protein [Hymenobacter sp. DG01]|uniref:zinc-dependent metalloprotease family protein n=1 Tax=Hymenobacter sp. DG01 TaxID=2584940 RepID=UPI0011243FC7|nr:zinc-dependent metalloprotease family protein [Hymenobacter sp. DG01]